MLLLLQVLNKIDLMPTAAAVEVWQRIRGINDRARIEPCVRGQVDTAGLLDLDAFDLRRMADGNEGSGGGGGMHEHGHGETHEYEHHEHAHMEHAHMEHAHMESGQQERGHGESRHRDHDRRMREERGDSGGAGSAPAAQHEHDHTVAAHRHNKHVGTFSLVHDGMAIEPLAFGRRAAAPHTTGSSPSAEVHSCDAHRFRALDASHAPNTPPNRAQVGSHARDRQAS